jgi:hypothetical protein
MSCSCTKKPDVIYTQRYANAAGQAAVNPTLPSGGTAVVLLLVVGAMGAAYWAMTSEQKEQNRAWGEGRSYYRRGRR